MKPKSDFEIKEAALRDKFGDPPAKGYQPLDPISVEVKFKETCEACNNENYNKSLLAALPNEAVRLAIGQADKSGNISFGAFTANAKTGSYVVVLDYIKYDSKYIGVNVTDEIPMSIKLSLDDTIYDSGNKPTDAEIANMRNNEIEYEKLVSNYFSSQPYWSRPYKFEVKNKDNFFPTRHTMTYNIPVYEGIGVRLVASITVKDSSVNLGSLYGLAAAAQDKKIQGSLIVQTLGLSGENISPQIPLPSEINVTTIQNAIQALATIKSKIFDANVSLTPVVLAIDDYIGRPGAKEQIVSALRENGNYLNLLINANPKKNAVEVQRGQPLTRDESKKRDN